MKMTRSTAAVAAIVAAVTLAGQGLVQAEEAAVVLKRSAQGPCDDSAATVAVLNGTGVNTSACIGASADGECQAVCAAGYAALGEGASSTTFTCSTDTFVKKEGEGDLVCGAQACTTLPIGDNIDHSDCDGKVTGETCQVACATGFTGAVTDAACSADGAFAYTQAAPSCLSSAVGGGGAPAAACNATGYSDLTAWFDDIAEHVTTLSEIDGEAAKKAAFVKDMLPSLKAKICENKAALEEVSWGSTCDMITTEAMTMLTGDSACLCGGKCEEMWDILTQEDEEGEEDSDPFADPTAQECRYANCYVTEACAAVGTNMEPMMDNLTAMVETKCGAYLSALVDGAKPTRGPSASIMTATFAGLMALF